MKTNAPQTSKCKFLAVLASTAFIATLTFNSRSHAQDDGGGASAGGGGSETASGGGSGGTAGSGDAPPPPPGAAVPGAAAPAAGNAGAASGSSAANGQTAGGDPNMPVKNDDAQSRAKTTEASLSLPVYCPSGNCMRDQLGAGTQLTECDDASKVSGETPGGGGPCMKGDAVPTDKEGNPANGQGMTS